jgi:hypothetical protein
MKHVPIFVGWTAAALFTASWFLPALEQVPGWMAFRYALSPPVPYGEMHGPGEDDSIPQVMSALTNVVFVILFTLWAVKQSLRPGLFIRIALACFLLNLYWPVQAWRGNALHDLRLGYYLWLASFLLLTVLALLNVFEARRTSRTPTAGTPS